jgi:sensor histidine kinase YesM
MNKFFRRAKNHWIYPKFQFQIVAFGLGIGLINLVMTWVAIEIFFRNSAQALLKTGSYRLHFIAEYIAIQKGQMFWVYAGLFSATLFVSTILGILLSHRAAGPLYRLSKQFESIKNGADPEPIQFRKKDFFQGLANNYNETLKKNI